ncbi:hypothetical protein ACFXPW_11550 [Streptomyces goshikiensis]
MTETIVVAETPVYVAPALQSLGTVTGATLGSAGTDNPDDTQYWS